MAAIEKKMINPVTSTKVATNGAEAVAGSKPAFFNNRGIIEPDKVPQRTTKISDRATLIPIHTQKMP